MNYTGKAINLRDNGRGVEFEVEIKDETGRIVFNRTQWVSTGVMTATDAKQSIKNVVERMTQDVHAHIEGTKEVLSSKSDIDSFEATCNIFIEPKDRAGATKISEA
jgi:hypothetical protein